MDEKEKYTTEEGRENPNLDAERTVQESVESSDEKFEGAQQTTGNSGKMKFCSKCGTPIPSEQVGCSNCGYGSIVDEGNQVVTDKKPDKKKLFIGLGVLGAVVVVVCIILAVVCFHEWKPATCTEAETCEKCGKTKGEPLGHTWLEATCTESKSCSVCEVTKGDPLGHSEGEWEMTTVATLNAKGEETKKCTVCSEVIDTKATSKTPGISGDGFNFEADEFYTWFKSQFNSQVQWIESGQEIGEGIPAYGVYINGEDPCLMGLKKGSNGNVCTIMFGSDEEVNAIAWGMHAAECIAGISLDYNSVAYDMVLYGKTTVNDIVIVKESSPETNIYLCYVMPVEYYNKL